MTSRQRRGKIKVSDIRSLSGLQVTETEAAAFFKMSVKAFREVLRIDAAAKAAWEEGREVGKTNIRRAQFKLAEKNAPMAIFLGKQYLGQSEVQVIEHSGRNGGPIETMDLKKLSMEQRRHLRDALLTVRGTRKPE